MSLWNRIGEVATNAGKFVGEVAGGVAGSAKFAWDVATAPFNNAEEYNGFVNTFKNAAAENQKAIAKPIASVGNAIMKIPGVAPALQGLNTVNQELLREPAATVNLVQGDIAQSGNILNYFNPAEWKKAYQGAQSISLGQAWDYSHALALKNNFNIYDPKQREEAFKNSAWGKATSGTIDAYGQLGLDVSLGAGRAIKAAKASTLGVGAIRTADDAAQAAEDITKAQVAGVKNRFTKPLEDFTKNDSLYALNHPMIKSSSNPGLLAHMLGESTDVNTTAEILRSALGDPQAMADLAVKRADLTQALDLAKSNLDAIDNYKLFAVPDGSGMLPFMSFDKGVLKEAKDNYDALIKNDKYLAKLMQVGQGGGSLTRTTGTALQSAEDFVAKSRALKFYDKTIGNSKIEFYQPTPFHKMYQKISWSEGERPAGLVDLNDPDSYKEIVAELNRVTPGLTKVGAVSQEEANDLLNKYIGAATPEARNQAAFTLENTLFKRIADKHGVDPDVAEEIYNDYKYRRASALQTIKDQGFMIDSDKSILKVQQLESQSADFLPLMDFELMDKLLKRNAETLNMIGKTSKVVGQGKDTILHYGDFLQDAFKAGALLRLGYTLRNGLDSQLRIAASVGALTSLGNLGQGLKNLMYNTYKTAGNMVDDLKVIPGEKVNFKQVEKNRVNVLKEINAHDKKIAELEAKISLKKLDTSFYHGTSKRLDINAGELKWLHNNADSNLFGSGFYTTDDINTAIGYTKKGKGSEPTVYKVSWKKANEPKLLNLDNKLTPEIKDIFIKTIKQFDTEYELPYGLDDVVKQIEKFDITGSDAWQLLKDELHANAEESYGGSSEIVYEGIERISKALEENGYDGLAHTGGSFRGKKDHNVKIFFNPSNLSLKEINKIDGDLQLPDFIDAIGKLGVEQTLRAEKQGIFEHYTDLIANRAEKSAKRYIGTGTLPIYTSDGKVYFLDDAFGGKLGQMFRDKTSSSASFQRLVDTNTDLYSKNLASKGIGVVKPEDPQYFEQWAQTINRQFGNSKVVKKLAAGESVDDIAKWLRSSPEGRDLRSRLGLSADDSAEYVTKINGFFDRYLPETSGLRGKLGEITPNDLRKIFKDPADLPVIHGHVLRNNIGNLDRLDIRKFVNGAFKILGTMPEDAWARHPLYIKLYRDEARRRLNILSDLKQATVTPAEQQAIMAESHKIAQRGMKEILFNIERKSNLAAAFKYLSPFFSAQENAWKTWMKFAANNPAIVNKGYQVWEAPNKAGLVTDQDGNPVPEGETTGNDNIWIQLPKSVSKIPVLGKGLASLDNMAIPKQSLDVLFQGGMDLAYNKGSKNVFGDFFPIGPYVAIPASEIVKHYEGKVPNIQDAFKWALPYGSSTSFGSLDQFLPAWYKRAQTMSSGMDDKKYAQTFQLIWTTEQYKAKQEGLPPVSDKKIADMTSAFYKMRIAANLILPFAPKFDSPYRFYMDQYRAFQKQYGLDADRKFLDPQTGYPDFFDFATSLSKNPTSINSTESAVLNARKYSDLVGDIYKEIPALVGFVVNDPKDSKFSPAAYNWLSTSKVSPSSPDTFKQSQSPAEARKKNEASRGWATYGQLTDYIDEQLKTRGLTSISQKGAEDLQAAKQAVIDNLAYVRDAQGNPVVDKTTGQNVKTAWYDDYLDTDGSKTNRVISGLGKVLDNTKFMEDHKDDPTWKSVRLYLNLRQTLAAQLASRAVKSIDAKANQDIKTAYDVVVDSLKQDDGFKNMYDRLLSQDLVYEKYLTPKESK